MSRFDQILSNIDDRDKQYIQNSMSGISNENRKLRNQIKHLEPLTMSSKRRLTYKAHALAVTEPTQTSMGKSVRVEVAEILNSDLYSRIAPLVGPILEASVRTIQGSDLSRSTPLKELGDDGRPSDRPLLDSDGEPVIAPSTLSQVKEFYEFLGSNPEVQDHIEAINRIVSEYSPSWKSKAPNFKGVVDSYKDSTSKPTGKPKRPVAPKPKSHKSDDYEPEF